MRVLPRIAILGRPNVGKSSLFNRLAGRRVSIVDPTPGTTRDRVEATIELRPPRVIKTRPAKRSRRAKRLHPDEDELDAEGDSAPGASSRFVDLVDTGGWGVYVAEGKRFDDAGKDLASLTPEIEAQILSAARSADLILFVVDARTGAIALDERIVELLRRERLVERVVAIANKADDSSVESEIAALARFGFGVPHPVSAKSGRGLAKLRAVLLEHADRISAARAGGTVGAAPPSPPPSVSTLTEMESSEDGEADETGIDPTATETVVHTPTPRELKIALIGRRNAGKSSVVNALAGEPRMIVSEIAGTTRDAIDVRFEIDGRVLIAIDTAGVRKRKSWDGDIEYYANLRTQESIRRADVCILLLDAAERVSQVEKNLAMQLVEAYKPTIIAVNKWDLVKETLKPDDYLEYLGQELPGLSFAPIAFVSAASRQGMRDLIAMCFNLAEQASHRETTGRVNAAIERVLTERGPSSKLGTKAKVFYVTQIDVRPPTLALVVNKPELFEGSYQRYLENKLRDELPFSEVPIRLIFSARKREEWGSDGSGGKSGARDDKPQRSEGRSGAGLSLTKPRPTRPEARASAAKPRPTRPEARASAANPRTAKAKPARAPRGRS